MKRIFILLLPLLLLMGCKPGKSNFSTPEETFETMLKAIADKDIKTYASCWHTQKNDEGLVSSLGTIPALWETLQEVYRPGTKLLNRKETVENGMTVVAYDIEVPNTNGETFKTGVSMVQEQGLWKMWHW